MILAVAEENGRKATEDNDESDAASILRKVRGEIVTFSIGICALSRVVKRFTLHRHSQIYTKSEELTKIQSILSGWCSDGDGIVQRSL